MASIRNSKPNKLYIAADGPRTERKKDFDLCIKTRENCLKLIDWECDVKTLFREDNIGLKYSVTSAINWLFEHEENGTILEDDCVPHFSFYPFCDELLVLYNNDSRVGMISGNNYGFELYKDSLSYSFSRHGLI